MDIGWAAVGGVKSEEAAMAGVDRFGSRNGRVEVLFLVSINEGCVADEGEEADASLAGCEELEGPSASMRRFCG